MASRSRFFYVRVAILSAALIVVIAYAWHDVHERHARKTWDHTLAVAVVVLREGAVSDSAIDALRDRGPALEARLTSELHRYIPNAPPPFRFTFFGPVDVKSPPPAATSNAILDLASHAWDLHQFLGDIDARAKVASGAYDSRIYVTVRVPTGDKHMVEGASEQGGRVGTVTIDLDDLTTDFALAVIAHELFHTLDATDKYRDSGETMIPEGLAEPDAVPQFPQRFVEVMARARPISTHEERVLDTLDELAVGPGTAREIGWIGSGR